MKKKNILYIILLSFIIINGSLFSTVDTVHTYTTAFIHGTGDL